MGFTTMTSTTNDSTNNEPMVPCGSLWFGAWSPPRHRLLVDGWLVDRWLQRPPPSLLARWNISGSGHQETNDGERVILDDQFLRHILTQYLDDIL